jgi:hypothetical protein
LKSRNVSVPDMVYYCDTNVHIVCSVSDKSLNEEVGQKELVNIEGVISDRLHTDVKYSSEKTSHGEGYGIPGKLMVHK